MGHSQCQKRVETRPGRKHRGGALLRAGGGEGAEYY